MSASAPLVTLDDVKAAREVIAGRLHRTPVMRSTYIGERAGVRLWLKMELFQKTGSFKPRGVLNRLGHLTAKEKARGVITLSAGNHAQALAWAARQAGIQATVVMPAGAVRSKVEATRGYGAEVVQVDGDLMAACLALKEERNLTLIHPFDDLHVIAGQGTVGLEIVEDVPDIDCVFVGVGGGGLISGVSAVVKAHRPAAHVVGVEPQISDVMIRSLEAGTPAHLQGAQTIADGLNAPFVGRHNLAHAQAFVDEMITVSDDEIVQAMRLLMERCKVVAEPAGAASVAGLLSGRASVPSGATVVCVVSGGNVDRDRLKQLL
ncbi:MAG TPA: threonine/serine dehydratase [Chthonomonadaceae bacterium]|nr:threonine/serine dehydratase [Chthonomonadaceae bacterium]